MKRWLQQTALWHFQCRVHAYQRFSLRIRTMSMEIYTQLQCRALVAQLARPCDWNWQGQGLNPGCSSVSNKTLHLTVSNYIPSYSTCTHSSLYDGGCTSSDVIHYYWWYKRCSRFDGVITGSTHHCSSYGSTHHCSSYGSTHHWQYTPLQFIWWYTPLQFIWWYTPLAVHTTALYLTDWLTDWLTRCHPQYSHRPPLWPRRQGIRECRKANTKWPISPNATTCLPWPRKSAWISSRCSVDGGYWELKLGILVVRTL